MPRRHLIRRETAGSILLASLLLLVLVVPIAVGGDRSESVLRTALGFTAIACVGLLSNVRWALFAMVALALVHEALHLPEPPLITALQSQVVVALQLALIAGFVVRHLMRVRQATADTVASAVSGYLLLAMLWATFYSIAELASPGSFLVHDVSVSQHPMGHSTFFYFSLVTISTLGFGDIVPATPRAGLLTALESVVGQFYIAILVARIVALQVVARRDASPAD
ncbi:MAG: hypothetical protein JRG76_06120 [Deltaproteobacteria bacterium]|nr:hypothetical protein [Deltaproteobacteria bacterium]MBW2414071.1 hypothetical protein [Deltaproteobacteria bacterium]